MIVLGTNGTCAFRHRRPGVMGDGMGEKKNMANAWTDPHWAGAGERNLREKFGNGQRDRCKKSRCKIRRRIYITRCRVIGRVSCRIAVAFDEREKKTLQITHVASATTRRPDVSTRKNRGRIPPGGRVPGRNASRGSRAPLKRIGGLNNTFLTVRHVLKVDIGVAERPSGDHVAAHPDGQNCADRAEFLEQHCLGHVRMQVSNVQRSHFSAV